MLVSGLPTTVALSGACPQKLVQAPGCVLSSTTDLKLSARFHSSKMAPNSSRRTSAPARQVLLGIVQLLCPANHLEAQSMQAAAELGQVRGVGVCARRCSLMRTLRRRSKRFFGSGAVGPKLL